MVSQLRLKNYVQYGKVNPFRQRKSKPEKVTRPDNDPDYAIKKIELSKTDKEKLAKLHYSLKVIFIHSYDKIHVYHKQYINLLVRYLYQYEQYILTYN